MFAKTSQQRLRLESLETRRLLAIDLSVELEAIPEVVVAGEPTSYAFRVSNTGDETATCVVIEHQPRGLEAPTWTQQFEYPKVMDLDRLDGTNGFTIGHGPEVYTQIAGDVNGDGIDDLLVNEFSRDGGTVSIVFGRIDLGELGYLPDPARFLRRSQRFTIPGVIAEDQARLGDINGDGLADFAVKTHARDAVTTEHYLVFGRTDWGQGNGFAIEDLSGRVEIKSELDLDATSPAGDVNGDGLDDAVLKQDFRGRTSFQLLLGHEGITDSSVIDVAESNAIVAFPPATASVFPAGDFDGDGYDDLLAITAQRLDIIRASFDEGEALAWIREQVSTEISSVGALGDVNSDGFDDFALASHGDTWSGAHIVFGNPTGRILATTRLKFANHDESMIVAASAGDLNADGIDDFLLGNDDGNGVAIVAFGDVQLDEVDEIPLSDATFRTNRVPYRSYYINQGGLPWVRSIFGNGDVNGDGVADMIIGGTNRGFLGAFDGELESYVLFGTPQHSGSGAFRHNLSIRANESIQYVVAGTAARQARELSIIATATSCHASPVAPDADIKLEFEQDLLLPIGEEVDYQIRVTNQTSETITTTFDSPGSSWFEQATWEIVTGVSPTLNLNAAATYPQPWQYAYQPAAVRSAGDVNGDGQSDLTFSAPPRRYDDTGYYLQTLPDVEATRLGQSEERTNRPADNGAEQTWGPRKKMSFTMNQLRE